MVENLRLLGYPTTKKQPTASFCQDVPNLRALIAGDENSSFSYPSVPIKYKAFCSNAKNIYLSSVAGVAILYL